MIDPILIICRHLDNDLSGEETQALAAWIESSPENAELFAKVCMLESDLRDELGLLGQLPDPPQTTNPQFIDEQRLVIEPAHTPRRVQGYRRWGLVAAIAILACVAWQALDTRTDPPTPGDSPAKTAQQPPAKAGHLAPSAPAVAMVARALDAGPDFEQGRVLGPGINTVEQGFIELQMLRGASVLLQAPCRFELIDDNQLYLFEGQLSADVPQRARYFTVQTPSMKLVDLGTRFGATVNARGDVRAAVFEGEVTASDVNSQQDASASHSLRGGDAINASIDHGLDTQAHRLEPDHGYLTTWQDIIHRVQATGHARYFVHPPASIGPNGHKDPDNMIVFREKAAELQDPIRVCRAFDGESRAFSYVTLPRGTRVMSYLIQLASDEEQSTANATLRFPGRVLGLVSNHKDNLKVDALFGLEGVDYWGGAERTFLSSIDPGTPDRFRVTGDGQNVLEIALHAAKHSDRARVLVEAPME